MGITNLYMGPGLKAMTHQTTQLFRVGSGSVGICAIGLQLDVLLYSSQVPDCLVGSRPLTTKQLSWVG